MNTGPELPALGQEVRSLSDPEALNVSGGAPVEILDKAAALELALQHEQDQRREERFFWIFGIIIGLDVPAFYFAGLSSVMIFALELVLVLGLARWLGVEWIAVPLLRLFDRVLSRIHEPKSEKPAEPSSLL